MWIILALNVMAQTACPSMQGEWTCYYKKDPSRTCPMTITDRTPPGGPLTLEVRSYIDGANPSTFVADGQSHPSPPQFGEGQVRTEPHQNRCGGIKSEFDVVTKGERAKIQQYLYPERGGIVRIFRKVQPPAEHIPQISCRPVIKPRS